MKGGEEFLPANWLELWRADHLLCEISASVSSLCLRALSPSLERSELLSAPRKDIVRYLFFSSHVAIHRNTVTCFLRCTLSLWSVSVPCSFFPSSSFLFVCNTICVSCWGGTQTHTQTDSHTHTHTLFVCCCILSHFPTFINSL